MEQRFGARGRALPATAVAVVVVAVTIAVAGAGPAASAAERRVSGRGQGGGRVVLRASAQGTASRAASRPPSTRPSAPPARPPAAPDPFPERRVRSLRGVSFVLDPCLTISPAGVIVPDPTVPGCGPGSGRAAPVRPSAAALAAEAVRNVDLPVPEPWIAPGEAITGLRSYLEIGGARLDTPVVDLDGVVVRLEATVTDYQVDWGDGSPVRRGVVSRGGPFPSGDVSHVYERAGTWTVRVRARWRVAWSTQGESGVIAEPLETDGAITGFRVREVQAVIGR